MAQQDESQRLKAATHDNSKKEAFSQAAHAEFKNEAFSQAAHVDLKKEAFSQASQKPPISGQMMTPSTPRNRSERPHTDPLDTPTPAPPSSPPPQPQSQSPEPRNPRQQDDDGHDEQVEDDSGHQPVDEGEAPHVLPAFDWEALEREYEEAMEKANEAEFELGEEFKLLANFFANWSNVSFSQDEGRAFKRFRTRGEHVRHSEDLFEAKKMHYEKVVDAFKAAVGLLQSD